MPMILKEDDEKKWLNNNLEITDIASMLNPCSLATADFLPSKYSIISPACVFNNIYNIVHYVVGWSRL
jgi:putative SOS response-associated peptidase YedK